MTILITFKLLMSSTQDGSSILDNIKILKKPFFKLKLNVLKRKSHRRLDCGTIITDCTYSIWNNIMYLFHFYLFQYEIILMIEWIIDENLLKYLQIHDNVLQTHIQQIHTSHWHINQIMNLIKICYSNHFKQIDFVNINSVFILYMNLIESSDFNNLLNIINIYNNKYKLSNNL